MDQCLQPRGRLDRVEQLAVEHLLLPVVAGLGFGQALLPHLQRLSRRHRQRLPHPGSGFSASPIASDGKIYLANEDGDMLVVSAGPDFKHLSTNSMGEFLMATPAISDGVMYIRSASTLWAIGRKQPGPARPPQAFTR